ncbi:MAG: DUF1292 domain-containing protein [Ruminococcaceae bacterium]|nr:DUF1292 domain-containing protein [Oscillospiraceae bacterium]
MDKEYTQDMDENEESTFVLTDEEGNEYPFTLLDFVDYEEDMYVVLAPADSDPESEEDLELVVMQVVMTDDGPSFEMFEDDELAEAVLDKFISSLDEAEE